MWFIKKPKKQYYDLDDVMKLTEERFEDLHSSIVKESMNLSKEQRNFLEKELIIKMVDNFVSVQVGIVEDELLKEFKRQILIVTDNLWGQKEPDRQVTLLG